MSRDWGPTGIGEYRPPRMSPDCREHLEVILKEHQLTDPEIFFKSIAEAIGRFDTHGLLRMESSPGAVRNHLRAAIEAAKTLETRLYQLDGNSLQLISEGAAVNLSSLLNSVKSIRSTLERGKKLADKYPKKGGRLPEDHKFFLAADVRDAMRDHLKEKLTMSHGGLFEQVLITVLEEALGGEAEVKSVDRLMKGVLSKKVKLEGPGGLTEYVPPRLTKKRPKDQ